MIAQSDSVVPLRSLRQMRQEQRNLHRAAVNQARQNRTPEPPPIINEAIVNALRAQIGSARAMAEAGQVKQATATATQAVRHLLLIAWRLTKGKPNANPDPETIPQRLFQRGKIEKPAMTAMRKAAKGEAATGETIEQARRLLALVTTAEPAEAQKKPIESLERSDRPKTEDSRSITNRNQNQW